MNLRFGSLRRFLLCLALGLPVYAQAAGTAVIQGDDQKQFVLEYNGSDLRLESDAYRDLYLVARNGTVYAVAQAGGQPIVVEGKAVLGLLTRAGGGRQLTGNEDLARFVSLEPTGKKESVAGLPGQVYRLTYVDRQGKTRTEEAVLGNTPELVQMTQAFGRIATDFQRNTGVDNQGAQALLGELQARNLGLLRFGRHYRLVSLNPATPPAARFALPNTPLQLGGLEQLIPGLLGTR